MSVPTLRKSLPIYAGNTWIQPFVFKVGGLREDLSAFTDWACQWRLGNTQGDPITLAVDASEAANGLITITATPEQTRAMAGNGVCDFEAVDGSVVRTFVRFNTSWTEDVTRA